MFGIRETWGKSKTIEPPSGIQLVEYDLRTSGNQNSSSIEKKYANVATFSKRLTLKLSREGDQWLEPTPRAAVHLAPSSLLIENWLKADDRLRAV